MKIQIVLLCILLLDSASCIDPGHMIRSYGFNIDTSRLTSKITNGLYQPMGLGVQIGVKSESGCLDGYKSYDTNGVDSPSVYVPRVCAATCDSQAPTQKWKMINGQMQIWAPVQGTRTAGGIVCFDCTSGAEDCYIEAKTCNSSRIQQQFYFRVHPPQLDIMTERIYFAIHSGANRKRCLTSYYSTEKGGQTYALDRCSGLDEQSFYINQDYSAEIQSVKSRVRVCASDSYAPACRSLYCPGK